MQGFWLMRWAGKVFLGLGFIIYISSLPEPGGLRIQISLGLLLVGILFLIGGIIWSLKRRGQG